MGSRLESNSNAVRKRIENHTFSDEAGEEYEPSAFGGFSDYFRRKKIKLQNLDSELRLHRQTSRRFSKVLSPMLAATRNHPFTCGSTNFSKPDSFQLTCQSLHRDLVQHGAGFLQYLDSKTMATHIIASSLPPKNWSSSTTIES